MPQCIEESILDDIEDCVRPVIRAVKTSGGADADKWAKEMQKADRVGFICEHELALSMAIKERATLTMGFSHLVGCGV